jgi:LCCL domain
VTIARRRARGRVVIAALSGLAVVFLALGGLWIVDRIREAGILADASTDSGTSDGLVLPGIALPGLPAPSMPAEPIGDPWSAHAIQHRGKNGQLFDYDCPPNGTAGVIWGTMVYTDDSSVCTAAVHQGHITLEAGGTVWISIRPGLAAYAATTRNGITSEPWPEWEGSFVIVGP